MQFLPSMIAAALPAASSINVVRFTAPLEHACAEFGIDTPDRVAAFLAQVAHESGNLSHVVENLNYSADGLRKVFPRYFSDTATALDFARQPQRIASRVYAARMGNGDESTGDGWRFRGRGLIQVTGRANYAACGQALGLDLIATPELLEQPGPSARSAAWFWYTRRLNAPADRGDIEEITRAINGGLNGLDDRKAHYAHALAALNPRHD